MGTVTDRAQPEPERETAIRESDLEKVRSYLCRLAKLVTRPSRCGFQTLRRNRSDGAIEYQIFADTEPNGTQIAWVQSTRHDAEFISACLAQAPLFDSLLSNAAEITALRQAVAQAQGERDHERDEKQAVFDSMSATVKWLQKDRDGFKARADAAEAGYAQAEESRVTNARLLDELYPRLYAEKARADAAERALDGMIEERDFYREQAKDSQQQFLLRQEAEAALDTKDQQAEAEGMVKWWKGRAAAAEAALQQARERDLTNHHNALVCPYCNPDKLELIKPGALQQAQAGQGWQPIATAPKDGTTILLRRDDRVTAGNWEEWTNTASEFHASTGEYLGQSEQDSGEAWISWDGGFTDEAPPTHWLPLPAPPLAAQPEEAR